MKVRVTALAMAALLLPAAANAQVTIDMNAIKCSQYLAMQPGTSRAFSAWMSGWFSYQTRKTYVDLVVHEQNVKNVQDWCVHHPNDKVMTGLQNAIGPQ
jgi:HdeA/HdeB family